MKRTVRDNTKAPHAKIPGTPTSQKLSNRLRSCSDPTQNPQASWYRRPRYSEPVVSNAYSYSVWTFLTACRKDMLFTACEEITTSCPFSGSDPYRLEGATLASRLASRDYEHSRDLFLAPSAARPLGRAAHRAPVEFYRLRRIRSTVCLVMPFTACCVHAWGPTNVALTRRGNETHAAYLTSCGVFAASSGSHMQLLIALASPSSVRCSCSDAFLDDWTSHSAES